ncbi:MAG: outer membrane beta-barrel family protein, partial [Bacteroidota bacterium]
LNWFANYGLNYNERPGEGSAYLEQDVPAGTFFQDLDRQIDRSGISNSLRLGIDYLPSEKETLTGSFLMRISDDDNFGRLQYDDYLNDYPNNLVVQTLRTDDEREDESNSQYSINYRREYSSRKHTLEATIQYQDNLETESSDFVEKAVVFDGRDEIPDLIQRSANAEGERQWLFQVDFKKPVFDKGNFELGLRSSIRMINNDYKVEELKDGGFESLPGLSNIFDYDENVHALYSQIGNEWGKLSGQFGLRAEYTDVVTLLQTTNEINPRDYFNLFPSAFLNYGFNEANSLQVSYSRRIRRPRFWDLNPFFTFSDSRNTFSGNPNLDPEFTDSYEINYIRYMDDLTLSGGVFYRHTTDVIQRVLTFLPNGTTNRQPENLSTRDDVGVELTFQYSGLKWLNLDGNANFFRQQINGQNFDDGFSADNITWFGRLTPRIKIGDVSDLQLRFNYRAPRETVQGTNRAIASLDIGWSLDVLDKQGTLTLSVRDVFNDRRRRSTTVGEGFFRESEFQWRARTTNLAFN